MAYAGVVARPSHRNTLIRELEDMVPFVDQQVAASEHFHFICAGVLFVLLLLCIWAPLPLTFVGSLAFVLFVVGSIKDTATANLAANHTVKCRLNRHRYEACIGSTDLSALEARNELERVISSVYYMAR
jgi:hypothetical protein